jgi:hypothetical protein
LTPTTPWARPWAAGLEIAAEDLAARAVEAEAVDHRFVLGQAEQTRLCIAGLGARRDGARLDEAEAHAEITRDEGGVLVETGGQADGIGKRKAPERRSKGRILEGGRRREQAPAQAPSHDILGRLRRQEAQTWGKHTRVARHRSTSTVRPAL